MGIKTLRTTSYHPQCNGMVERVHRVLKERLMARSASAADWMANLPFVLLGLRAATREDAPISPAHLVYGAPLRLPGEFFDPESRRGCKTSDFVSHLQRSLRDMTPAPAEFHSRQRGHASPPASLRTAQCVFVRVDAVRRPLSPPYVGPYEVLERNEKTFVLLRAGKPWTVSVDRLKPHFSPVMSAPSSPRRPPSQSSKLDSSPSPATPSRRSQPSPLPPAAPALQTSRFGRRLRPPDRYSP